MLKIGDKVRITGIQDLDYVDEDTKRVWTMLAQRNRPVTISEIKDGLPWYSCSFKVGDSWEYHSLSIGPEETNWKIVVNRNTKIG